MKTVEKLRSQDTGNMHSPPSAGAQWKKENAGQVALKFPSSLSPFSDSPTSFGNGFEMNERSTTMMLCKSHKRAKSSTTRRWQSLVLVSLLSVWGLDMAAQAAVPGKDGDSTITSPGTIVNPASSLGQSASVGDTYLAVTNLSALQPLAAGDLLLVYQAQGASIDTTNSPSSGI
jgi:hypothetical protein